jgi:hypothetical protein
MGSKRGFCGLLAHFAESLLPHSTNVGIVPRLFGGSVENTRARLPPILRTTTYYQGVDQAAMLRGKCR